MLTCANAGPGQRRGSVPVLGIVAVLRLGAAVAAGRNEMLTSIASGGLRVLA